MFSITYVILPFSDIAPDDAIRASLAPFQLGGRREKIPVEWLTFQDDTEGLRMDYEALFTFIDGGKPELQIEGHDAKFCCISEGK